MKSESNMKSWTIGTSVVLVAAVFIAGTLLANRVDAIVRSLQNASSQQAAPSQPAAPIIILLPSPPMRAAIERTPSSVAHGKQETPIRP
ncbi:hypothetical protein LK996_07050 [Lysobacter sp. A6]|uniref:Uncharacterized protein n=1 Tax=Noviluteimonas lactosilytica TaxID=2888523 RepID=A0ABS8JH67_9GAMM|nr:hypothetical protein [Lysobacter lactosilyticus]MCC8362833.1 hypothetical protein [Lysobacter lactosilyticus]